MTDPKQTEPNGMPSYAYFVFPSRSFLLLPSSLLMHAWTWLWVKTVEFLSIFISLFIPSLSLSLSLSLSSSPLYLSLSLSLSLSHSWALEGVWHTWVFSKRILVQSPVSLSLLFNSSMHRERAKREDAEEGEGKKKKRRKEEEEATLLRHQFSCKQLVVASRFFTFSL